MRRLRLHPTPIMVRSLECRQRCTQASHAGAQRSSRAVAGPASIPGVIRIPHSANIGGRIEVRAERRRVGRYNRRFISPVDEQGRETGGETIIIVVRTRAEECPYLRGGVRSG